MLFLINFSTFGLKLNGLRAIWYIFIVHRVQNLQLVSDSQWANIMSQDKFNFDIGLISDSDDDNGLFLTQESSQNRQNLDSNQNYASIDLENLLDNTKDSAFDRDSSFERILGTQAKIVEKWKKFQKNAIQLVCINHWLRIYPVMSSKFCNFLKLFS